MRVPEGHPKIAQRFIAGSAVRPPAPSPGGTADVTGLSPQSSLRDSLAKHRNLYPSDKSLGYYQSSLRDEIHRGAVLCDTTASRYPFSCLPSTCVEQRGALPQATVRRGLRPIEDRADSRQKPQKPQKPDTLISTTRNASQRCRDGLVEGASELGAMEPIRTLRADYFARNGCRSSRPLHLHRQPNQCIGGTQPVYPVCPHKLVANDS